MIARIKKFLGIKTIIKSEEMKTEKDYYKSLLNDYSFELEVIKKNPNAFDKTEKDKMTNLIAIYKAKLGELE